MDGGVSVTGHVVDKRRGGVVCFPRYICFVFVHYTESHRYAALLKSGAADALAAQDLTIVPRFNEEDIQDAIEELKRSTKAIEKQTENLKLQQNAMSMLVKDNARLHQGRSQANKIQQGKWDMEKANTIAAVSTIGF
jgi:hypothetical protein